MTGQPPRRHGFSQRLCQAAGSGPAFLRAPSGRVRAPSACARRPGPLVKLPEVTAVVAPVLRNSRVEGEHRPVRATGAVASARAFTRGWSHTSDPVPGSGARGGRPQRARVCGLGKPPGTRQTPRDHATCTPAWLTVDGSQRARAGGRPGEEANGGQGEDVSAGPGIGSPAHAPDREEAPSTGAVRCGVGGTGSRRPPSRDGAGQRSLTCSFPSGAGGGEQHEGAARARARYSPARQACSRTAAASRASRRHPQELRLLPGPRRPGRRRRRAPATALTDAGVRAARVPRVRARSGDGEHRCPVLAG